MDYIGVSIILALILAAVLVAFLIGFNCGRQTIQPSKPKSVLEPVKRVYEAIKEVVSGDKKEEDKDGDYGFGNDDLYEISHGRKPKQKGGGS